MENWISELKKKCKTLELNAAMDKNKRDKKISTINADIKCYWRTLSSLKSSMTLQKQYLKHLTNDKKNGESSNNDDNSCSNENSDVSIEE